jgi:uncharacterized membrane-anchored protein
MKKLFLLASLSFLLLDAFAEKSDTTGDVTDTIDVAQLISRMDTFHYLRSGKVTLGNIAALDIPVGYKFLDGKQAASVLHDIWKNPYSESLGMLIPDGKSIFMNDCWAVEITYDEDGHVKDDDAKDIKYGELLSQMQEEVKQSNPSRVKQGGQAIELVGWAEEPYYDSKAHKLYWAKQLRAKDDTTDFLNYNIRVLGRKGVMVLNAIGGMNQLEEIKQQTPAILAATNFTKGNTYEEFDGSMDKVAAYGIAGLIAGGILAKTGILAKIGILLLKFIKPLMVAVAGLGAWVVRFFKGRREGDS